MMTRSTFFGIELGKRAIMAQRAGTDVVGHNLANQSTEGYSRQSLYLVPSSPFATPTTAPYNMAGQLGTGVMAETIARAQNEYITNQIRGSTSRQARLDVLADTYSQLEGIVDVSSDASLDQLLTDFFSAWHDLSLSPEETANRTALREAASTLASEFGRIDAALTAIREQLDGDIQLMVDTVNRIGADLAAVNHEIQKVNASDQVPNDLMDRRDALLLELSSYISITSLIQEDSSVFVTIGGRMFVQDDKFHGLATSVDTANSGYLRVVYADRRHLEVTAIGGKLMATLEARDQVVPAFADSIDDIASVLITEVNNLHRGGYGLNDTTGYDFFTGTDAGTIAVATVIQNDHRAIQAARDPSSPGDGRIALAIAQLVGSQMMALDGATLPAFYRAVISELGATADGIERAGQSENQVAAQLGTMRESQLGVNMDEELINLIRYEQGYAAASRVITTVDETLDRLINATGLVGL